MFCGECGTKNKKGAAFCEKCGAKLEGETNKEEKTKTSKVEKKTDNKPVEVKKERQPLSKQNKIIIGCVAAFVAILVASYMYLGSICKPEKVAIKYFKAYTSKDANKISKMIDLDEGEFVSKKLLKESLKDEEKLEIENYTIDNNTAREKLAKVFGVDKTDNLSKTITVKYIEKGTSKERYKSIKLVKSKHKKFLFFDNWKVDSSDLIAKNYKISVPKDSKAKLNGIVLGKKYKKDSFYTNFDVYEIPSILKGSYKLSVTLKSGISLSGDVKVTGNYGSFSSNNLKFDSKTEKKMKNEIKEKVKVIYDAVLEDKSFDDIKDNFEEDYRDEFEDTYNDVKKNALTDYNKLKEIKIKDVEIKYYSINDEEIRLTIGLKYDYKVEYKSGDETKDHSKSGAISNIYATYKIGKKDNKLSKIDSLPTYFSHYSF